MANAKRRLKTAEQRDEDVYARVLDQAAADIMRELQNRVDQQQVVIKHMEKLIVTLNKKVDVLETAQVQPGKSYAAALGKGLSQNMGTTLPNTNMGAQVLNAHEDARLKGLTKEIRLFSPEGVIDDPTLARLVFPSEGEEGIDGVQVRRTAKNNVRIIIAKDERHR
jgi:hypothetical protein